MEKLSFRTVEPQFKNLRFARGERLSFAYRGETAGRPRAMREIAEQLAEPGGEALVICHPAALPDDLQDAFKAAEALSREDFAVPANPFHADLNGYFAGVGFASRIYLMQSPFRGRPQMAAALECRQPDEEMRSFFGEYCSALIGTSAIVAVEDGGKPIGLLPCACNLSQQLASVKLRVLAAAAGLDPLRDISGPAEIFYSHAYAYSFGYYLSRHLARSPLYFFDYMNDAAKLLNVLMFVQQAVWRGLAALPPAERRYFSVSGEGIKTAGLPLMVDFAQPGLLAASAQERPKT